MSAKIILIYAMICIPQVFPLNLNLGSALQGLGISSNVLNVQNAKDLLNLKNLTEATKETYEVYNKFGDYMTLSIMESDLRKNSSKVVECYEQQRNVFKEIVNEFNKKVRELSPEIGKDLSEKPNKSERIQKILYSLGSTILSYNEKFNTSMNNRNFEKAANQMLRCKEQIKKMDNNFAMEMVKYGQNSPKKAMTVGRKYYAVRKETKRKAKIISFKIEKCLTS